MRLGKLSVNLAAWERTYRKKDILEEKQLTAGHAHTVREVGCGKDSYNLFNLK